MTRLRAAVLLATLVALAGCSADLPGPTATMTTAAGPLTASDGADAIDPVADEGTITIQGFVFAPNSVRLPAGMSVRWVNRDDAVHSIVANDRTAFGSGLLNKGEEFSFRPTVAGRIDYICGVHQYMKGRLLVE